MDTNFLSTIKRDFEVYQEHYDIKNVCYLRKMFVLITRTTFMTITFFRAASSKNKIICFLALPFYKIARIISGIQIKRGTIIGEGLFIPHYGTIVVNSRSKIGKNCIIMHNVTLGAKGRGNDLNVPVVGDNVYIGTGAILLGGISIGNNCVVGAGSVVTKDIKEGTTVAGNPAKEIRARNEARRMPTSKE